MRKALGFCGYGMLSVLVFISLDTAFAATLPDNIRQLAFNHLGFDAPIETTIAGYELGGSIATSAFEQGLWGGGYFIPEGYLVKTQGTRPGFDPDWYRVSESLKPYVRSLPNNEIAIRVAKRNLKAITFVSERSITLPMTGEKTPAWSFTFTYVVDPIMPRLTQVGPFTGKATVVRDPADGQWKVAEAVLNECANFRVLDRAACLYEQLLTERRSAAVQRRLSRVTLSNLRYEYQKKDDGRLQGVMFKFDVAGGRAPHSMGVEINGRPLGELEKTSFGRYTGKSRSLYFPLYAIQGAVQPSGSDSASGWLQIEMHRWGYAVFEFGWPSDLAPPLRVRITARDSASPPVTNSGEVTIDQGPTITVKKTSVRSNLDYWWINESGRDDEPPPALDVAGTWRGKAVYIERTQVRESPMELVLQQTGATLQGVGTIVAEGRSRGLRVAGTLRANRLVLEGRYDEGGAQSFEVRSELPDDGGRIDASWSAGLGARWKLERVEGSKAVSSGVAPPTQSLPPGAGLASASPPPQGGARPKISDLTRGVPNAEYFQETERSVKRGFETVWTAAKRVISRQDLGGGSAARVRTEDRDQGILITEPTVHTVLVLGKSLRQYFVVVEPLDAQSTRVVVKGFCYRQRGQQWVTSLPRDSCSAGFVQDLDRELARNP